MELALAVNAPSVVGEIIDGEAVIMNLASGHYFSTHGSGAVIWYGIESRMTRASIVALLAGRYDATTEALGAALDAFIAELVQHGLVIESSARAGDDHTAHAESPRQPFDRPLLNVYTDMEELLLLDPIHDVSEEGWPKPKEASAA